MCTACKDIYLEALSTPLKGIDRPEHADDDWRPSILEHIRHAEIAIAFEERDKAGPPPQSSMDGYWEWYYRHRGFTPAQREQSIIWRNAVSAMKREGVIR